MQVLMNNLFTSNFNMKKFIHTIFLFVIFSCFISALLGFIIVVKYKITAKDIPALHFSESYSFNEKMMFLLNKNKNINTLAIGSSMTLYNLNSEVVKKELKSDSFLNTASWGMSIKDDYYFLKTLHKYFKIKQLLLSANIGDYSHDVDEKKIKYDYAENFLIYKKSFSVENFSIKYYLDNFEFARKVRSCKGCDESLQFDQSGGVTHKKKGFLINNERWKSNGLSGETNEIQYNYLDSIENFSKKNKIKLIVFESPFREGIYTTLSTANKKKFEIHLQKVRDICKKNNSLYVDANNRLWPDSLYVDAKHFNEDGAKLYTKYCFDIIKR